MTEQILERLLAKMNVLEEKADTNLKEMRAGQEHLREEMKANQEKMEAKVQTNNGKFEIL
jgi:hypothetical protein